MDKGKESAHRVKYIRLLERFIRSVLGTLNKDEDLTKEKFNTKIENSYKYLEKIKEKPTLYKTELVELEKLVEKILNFTHDEESTIEEISLEILRDANRVEKSKNKSRYKREKFTKSNW